MMTVKIDEMILTRKENIKNPVGDPKKPKN